MAPPSPTGCGLAAQASLFLVRRSPVYVEVAVPGCSSLFLSLHFLLTLICPSHSPLLRAREHGPACTSPPLRASAAGKSDRGADMWLSCWCVSSVVMVCGSFHKAVLDNIRMAMSQRPSALTPFTHPPNHSPLHFQSPRIAP